VREFRRSAGFVNAYDSFVFSAFWGIGEAVCDFVVSDYRHGEVMRLFGYGRNCVLVLVNVYIDVY
jgi:hypothetical protein